MAYFQLNFAKMEHVPSYISSDFDQESRLSELTIHQQQRTVSKQSALIPDVLVLHFEAARLCTNLAAIDNVALNYTEAPVYRVLTRSALKNNESYV
jgi:hypothetical protein